MKKASCQSKVRHTCGTKNYASCIEYQTDLPEFSELECPSIEETTEELYNLVGEIKEETDLSELGERCLEYLLDENDKIIVKNVLLKFEEEICNLKEELELVKNRQICSIPITECLPNLDCLALPCDTSITTLGDWMLAVQTKLCETP
jgi:hypothetical protein